MRFIPLFMAFAAMTFVSATESLSVPAQTYVSPVCIEGYSTSAPLVVLTVGGVVKPTNQIGVHTWYANVNLSADVTTAVVSAYKTAKVTKSTIWKSFDFQASTSLTLNARVGDRVNLKSTDVITQVSPTGSTIVVSGPVACTSAGTWTFSSTGRSLTLKVYGMMFAQDPKQPVSCRLSKTIPWVYPVPVLPDSASLFTSGEDTRTTATLSGDNVSILGTALGCRNILLRHTSATGPIVACVPVQTWDYDVTGIAHAPLVYPDGSTPDPTYAGITILSSATAPRRMDCTLILKPYVPNLRLSIVKFAHASTFIGGATSFTVLTDGSATSLGEAGFVVKPDASYGSIGVLHFTMLAPAAGDTYHCVNILTSVLYHGVYTPTSPTTVAFNAK